MAFFLVPQKLLGMGYANAFSFRRSFVLCMIICDKQNVVRMTGEVRKLIRKTILYLGMSAEQSDQIGWVQFPILGFCLFAVLKLVINHSFIVR